MHRFRQLLLLSFVALSGCKDSEPPEMLDVVGTYRATTFTQTGITGATTDLLALGASITLTLNGDRTTAGRLYVPLAHVGGIDIDEDLAGTWQIDAMIVTLDHDADTFLRDMEFFADGMQLSGDWLIPDASIRVVLSK
jgi:hypothetical protein